MHIFSSQYCVPFLLIAESPLIAALVVNFLLCYKYEWLISYDGAKLEKTGNCLELTLLIFACLVTFGDLFKCFTFL